MPKLICWYVKIVSAIGCGAGVVAMFLTFVLLAILVESSVARLIFGVSHIWSVEMAMFTMTAYYLLGGALSDKEDYHVRMDLFYSRLSPRARAIMDCITGPLVIFYLFFLFTGAIDSTKWAWENKQANFSAWAPPMTPIKLIMTVGIGLMLLQVIARWFRDLAHALGRSLE
jgi:TRAP-type C4-dicarboxylate transport system permease small subunit